jgi:hypothetical protein
MQKTETSLSLLVLMNYLALTWTNRLRLCNVDRDSKNTSGVFIWNRNGKSHMGIFISELSLQSDSLEPNHRWCMLTNVLVHIYKLQVQFMFVKLRIAQKREMY